MTDVDLFLQVQFKNIDIHAYICSFFSQNPGDFEFASYPPLMIRRQEGEYIKSIPILDTVKWQIII